MDEVNQELVREWLTKASRDLTEARIVARSPDAVWGASLYYCQQAAENALKGFLAYWDHPGQKTENLILLLENAREIEPCFDTWADAAARLTPYSTANRHPGTFENSGIEDLDEALDDADCIVRQALSFLPPEVHPRAKEG
jgi:HEPN domain-containing protein